MIKSFQYCRDDPGSISLNEIISQSIHADIFYQPSCIFQYLRIHVRITMTEIRHAFKNQVIHTFKIRRMIACPVTSKFFAAGIVLCPSLLAIESIDLFFIGTTCMVQHHVGIHLHVVCVSFTYKVL